VQAESEQLSKEISKLSRRITDKVVRIKLSEVISQLNKIKVSQTIKENHMTSLLIGYEILKELKSL
jgi:hypothetical protein